MSYEPEYPDLDDNLIPVLLNKSWEVNCGEEALPALWPILE